MKVFMGIGTAVLAGLVLGGCSSYHTGKLAAPLHAKAVIAGPGITGEARLYQEYEGRVRVKLNLQGTADSKLTPGLHVIHIHETGNCEPFTAAKGHFDGNSDPQVNPEANVSPGLGNHPYHLGDLQNLSVDENRQGSLYTPGIGPAALLLATIAISVLFLLWLPFSEAVVSLDPRLGRRIGAIGAGLLSASLPVAALLFLLLPRTLNPFWAGLGARPREGVSGVSDQLRLGDVGRVALSGEVAFRAEVEDGPLSETPYWRGAVLEATDGRRWTVSPLWRPATAAPAAAEKTRVTYYVEPHGDRQLFLLETPLSAAVGARTQLLGAGRVLRLPLPLARRIRYTGTSSLTDRYLEGLGREERALNLALPPGLPASIRELALRVGGTEREPRLVAQRLLAHFSRGYTYSLQVPEAAADPLEAFLLVNRTGYCEYFAAGLAIMLRACGIPARVVSGYLGGDFVPAGSYYLVTQASAHAWVEA